MTPYSNRYHVVESWPFWLVRCGTGTRTLFRSLRWITAARICSELECAFRDGEWVATKEPRDG